MKNLEIAQIFRNIRAILEIQGENPFRIRAYERAAQNLESLTEDIEEVAKAQELGSQQAGIAFGSTINNIGCILARKGNEKKAITFFTAGIKKGVVSPNSCKYFQVTL